MRTRALARLGETHLDALRASLAVRYGVVPQVVPDFISYIIYHWDINVRISTIIGFVGGGGIGYLLQQYMSLLQWDKAATCLWLIAFVVMAMDYASASARSRIV